MKGYDRDNFIVVSSGNWVGMFDFKARLLAEMSVDAKKLKEMRDRKKNEPQEN